jgi:hypothetical protein
MSHLGVLRGSGVLSGRGGELGRAEYELDGYLTGSGEIVASGEIRVAAPGLDHAHDRDDLKLTTDEGRVLDVRFSTKRAGSPNDVAHADVRGDLPPASEWRR